MAIGYGYDSWGSVVEESTYGQAVGAGESYFQIVSEDLIEKMEVKPRKSLNGVSPRATFLGHRMVDGSITLEYLFEGLNLFLKHGLGTYAFELDTPVAGANTHTFTLADTLPTGLNVEINKGDIPTGKTFLFLGGKVDSLDFQFTEEEIMALVVGLIARVQLPDTTASGTPTWPGDHPALWHYTGTLTLAGTAALKYKGGNIKLENKLDRRWLMDDATNEPDRGNEPRAITGQFTTEFEDLTLSNKFAVGTTGAFSLAFTSTEMVTGSTPYSITFTMPKVQLTDAPSVVPGWGPLEVTYPFMSMHDGSSTDALTIAIVNGEATLA